MSFTTDSFLTILLLLLCCCCWRRKKYDLCGKYNLMIAINIICSNVAGGDGWEWCPGAEIVKFQSGFI